MKIDINCDLGEGYGAYRSGDDELLMRYISSASIACGFHAGDYITMRECVRLCIKYGVAIGAHPGYPDLQGFGRRSIDFTPEEIYYMILYQAGALKSITEAEGGSLRHIKPHGAMYNDAAISRPKAMAIAEAVLNSGNGIILLGMASSEMEIAAEERGVPFAREAFPDRLYRDDGLLVGRTTKNAVITNPQSVAARALDMVINKRTSSANGNYINIDADSICIHGDEPGAAKSAKAVKESLEKAGISIEPFRGRIRG